MEEGIKVFLDKICNSLGQTGSFITFTGLSVLVSLINTTFCLFKKEYGMKNRVWGITLCLFFLLIQVALTVYKNESATFCLLGGALVLVFNLPVFIISKKPFKMTSEQIELVNTLKNKSAQTLSPSTVNEFFSPKKVTEVNAIKVKPLIEDKEEVMDNGYGLDFSHVKNVIKRFDYITLSPSDKRQVAELEGLLLSAERTGYSEQIKEKINEGLGALLKIMSKYGF